MKKSQSELDIIREEKSNLEAKYADLEKAYNELQGQINQINLEKEAERLKSLQDIEALKRKAQLIQEALDLEIQNNQDNLGEN